MLPPHFKELYSGSQIDAAVKRLGKEIGSWASEVWARSHTDILAIPVLRGGIFFFADLVREVTHSVEIAPARAWAYQHGENAVMTSEVGINIDEIPARGRSLLVVDDICDSGRTLQALREALMRAGAYEVRSAVLIKRALPGETFGPDWVAFNYSGAEWFVGYGMDDADRWRNLPAAYVMQK